MRKLMAGLLVGGSIFAAGSAVAATVTTTFNVKITITSQCLINSASDMLFASTGVIASNVDQTSSISVTCTNTTPYTVGISAGTNGGGTVITRKMKHATLADTVAYALFSDSARAVNWGDTSGTGWQSGIGNGTAQPYTVYGRVAAQTTGAPGNYTDNVTVTVTY